MASNTLKYKSNGSGARNSASGRTKSPPKSKTYRENVFSGGSGRTSSGKPVPMSKAGKGTCA